MIDLASKITDHGSTVNKELHRAIVNWRRKKKFRSQKGFHLSHKLFWERENTATMLLSGNQKTELRRKQENCFDNCSGFETLVIKMETSPKFISFSNSVHPRPTFASEPSHSNGECFNCASNTVSSELQAAYQFQACFPLSESLQYKEIPLWSIMINRPFFFRFLFFSPSIWGFLLSFFLLIYEGNIYSQGSAE